MQSGSMPTYYFDFEDCEGVTLDCEGLAFADPQRARDEAIRTLPDLARDALPLKDRCDFQVKVRDADGLYLCVVTLSLVAKWLP